MPYSLLFQSFEHILSPKKSFVSCQQLGKTSSLKTSSLRHVETFQHSLCLQPSWDRVSVPEDLAVLSGVWDRISVAEELVPVLQL